jgi:hypothetical protein
MRTIFAHRVRAWAPHAVVALWLVFLGVTVWWHAARSMQAPMWDPYSYAWKAKGFWDCVGRGEWCNPFDIEPTMRPPGTILLSYPFGFSPGYSGFHFRSVFLPVLCAALTPYLALGFSRAFAWGWGTCTTVLLFTALPMFYHFEWTPETLGTGGWGMVDGFISGVAALAGALVLRGLVTASVVRLAAGAALGAFTLFIKPAGAMVMALLAAMSVFLVCTSWLSRGADGSRRAFLRRFALPGGLAVGGIFAATAAVCVFSGYLSPANIAYARAALAFERTLPASSLGTVLAALYQSTGVFLPLWSATVALLSLTASRARPSDGHEGFRAWHLLVCALAMLVAGAWYWLVVQVLAFQVRYFWPFVWLACVCLVPAAHAVWRSAGNAARGALVALCVLPAVNLALLLPSNRPSAAWQKIAGVFIDVGTSRETEASARTFLARLPDTPGTTRIYSFQSDLACAVFEHVIRYDLLAQGRAERLYFQHAYDWARGFGIRTEDIANADFLLLVPQRERSARVDSGDGSAPPGSFDEENEIFISLISGLGEKDGLRLEIEIPSLRLVRVVDRPAFERSLARFVGSRRWRPLFEAENPRRWWTAAEIGALPEGTSARSVRFEQRYLVHALTLARSADGLTIDLWWEPLQPDLRRGGLSWFFHLIGRDGKIVWKSGLPLFVSPAPDPGQPVRLERVHIDPATAAAAVQVGFGIYTTNGEQLRADSGLRDWHESRVLLPLAAAGTATVETARKPPER